MAAATEDRNTTCKLLTRTVSYRIAAVKIFKGTMVRLNAAGFAIPADDAAGGSDVVGVADHTVDNTAGAAGALRIRCSKGVFGFTNDGNVVQATTGVAATALDDQTVSVAATTLNDHTAGIVDDFADQDDSMVYIHIA